MYLERVIQATDIDPNSHEASVLLSRSIIWNVAATADDAEHLRSLLRASWRALIETAHLLATTPGSPLPRFGMDFRNTYYEIDGRHK